MYEGGRRRLPDGALLRAAGLGRRVAQPDDEPGRWLLQDITLEFYPGEIVGVIGPSGAGKTVLLRALAGLDPIQTGEIRFRSRPLADYSMPSYRSQVVYLSQRPAIAEGSVEENLKSVFTLKAHRAKRYDAALIEEYLARVGRTPSFLNRHGSTLSGGEQQLVALLRALQLGPALLLLDEPTASIDTETVSAVESSIATWREGDQTRACLWITHDEEQQLRVARRTIRLQDGRIDVGEGGDLADGADGADRVEGAAGPDRAGDAGGTDTRGASE